MQTKNAIEFDLEQINASASEAADLLAVLANANRLMVLCHLLKKEMAVGPLAEAVGMTQSALSQQLARLRALKLVETRRDGRTIYYRLASREVAMILETLYDMFCSVDGADRPAPRETIPAATGALAE
ncbi:MAG: metalloregulator ArsR/SmtB family transcription factor [Rhizobiaceae bacterium]